MVRTFNTRYGLNRQPPVLVMLIEDDMDHAELIMRSTEEHAIPNKVIHFPDGQSALEYLGRSNPLGNPVAMPRPQLILLDVNLPGMDGITILRTIKESEELRRIPVVMLSTSATEHDIWRAYSHHANSYVVKPMGCDEFKELIDRLCSYWLDSNKVTKPPDMASETHSF